MTLHTRRQLVVLLLVLAAAGCGLAIGHWRRENPALVKRVEQIDRAPASAAGIAASESAGRTRAPRNSIEAESRRARRGRAPRESAAGAPRESAAGAPRESAAGAPRESAAGAIAADASSTPEAGGHDRTTDGSTPCP